MSKKGQGETYGRSLRMYRTLCLFAAAALVIVTGVVFALNRRAGWVALGLCACSLLVLLLLYLYQRPRVLQAMIAFSDEYGTLQQELLDRLEIAAAVTDADGRVQWMNEQLALLADRSTKYHGDIAALFPYLTRGVFPEAGAEKDIDLTHGERELRAHMRGIALKDGTRLNMIYLLDETDLKALRQENRDQKSVTALVYVDNYEEAMDDVDEVHSSLMNVLVDREINKYFSAYGCLSKKLEKDKYLVALQRKSLDEIVKDHFSVLEEVKTIHIGKDAGLTISVGVGLGGRDMNQDYDFARSAIEMALGRGGDQAIVNEQGQMRFYGGKTPSGERHTRVKARVKAQAMREIMETAEKVIAMGHQRTDMDSLGAAVGVYRAAKTLGKSAWIVVGDESPSMRGWLQMLRDSREYEEDVFISHERAVELTDNSTAVVVVDTNRPSMVECEDILHRTETIIVLDHHRQTTEQIPNAALSYIEPAASSASEMVAEVLQYFGEDVRLNALEADCLYGGIIIDTNNFMAKTGARTFEAAAYLRREGADIIRVRKALRGDMKSYKARAEAVRHAEPFMGQYAISVLPSEGLESPNVVGAQAANELLDIVGVKASFVVTEFDGRIFISARAIDEVNVQVIMEKLGGGGHMNIAGAQLEGVTVDEAVQKLRDTLTAMTQEKEI